MSDIKKVLERDELHRAIWAVADDLRGSVDGWDFKNYVLGTMFYRYISENLTNYINKNEIRAAEEIGEPNPDFDYAKMSDADAEEAREGLIQEKGFFMLPSELFCNVRARAAKDENLNETLEGIFNNIESSAKGTISEKCFDGLFDDFDVNSNKLGATVAKRNEEGTEHPGYAKLVSDLMTQFPLFEPAIVGEKRQKTFISLFGAILRMRNLLLSFDDFKGSEIFAERELQDYLGRYQDLKDEWDTRRKKGEASNVDDDIVFETELIGQIEINIDYILMLVEKYHQSNCEDKEILVTIKKAVDASPMLRSKKQLIQNFITNMDEVSDILQKWRVFIEEQKEKELTLIIAGQKLKEAETRSFIANALQAGEIKTIGTDIDKLMPPVSRFGGHNRAEKKQTVIDLLKAFFDRFYGL